MSAKLHLTYLERSKLYSTFIAQYNLEELYYWIDFIETTSSIVLQLEPFPKSFFSSKYLPFVYKTYLVELQPF